MNYRARSYQIIVLLTLVTLLTSGLHIPTTPHALAADSDAPLSNTLAGDAPSWIFQGPAPELYAQQDLINVAANQEPVTGNVVAIAPSLTNADLIYVAGANGGVWKTTNATAATPTWAPLTDNLKSFSMGALALDVSDATGQTVVAGTGRYSAFGSRGDDTVGLYYTTDGGATWTVTTDPQLAAAHINGVAARGSVLMASSTNGLFRTTTGPLGTWTKISGTGVLPNAPALALVADPANTSRFYATFGGATGGIFRTDDVGQTWTNVTAGISGIAASTTCFTAAVGPLGSVYALYNGVAATAPRALYRSTDSGATWTALDIPPGSYTCTNSASSVALSADKTNDALVYVATYESPIYRLDASKPAGQLPSQQYANIGDVNTTNAALNYGRPHPDNAALIFDANGGLLSGNHGGIFRLGNPGAPASASNVWASLNGNLGVSEVPKIAYDSLSNIIAGGLQDNGAAYQIAPDSTVWARRLASGDGQDVAVDTSTLSTNLFNDTPTSTTLAAAMSASTTTARVVAPEAFPAIGNFFISVDSEQMFVRLVSTATNPVSIASASQSGTTVTITTNGPHGFSAGQVVTIAGVSVAGYNGTFTIAYLTSATSFVYGAASGLAPATGGTATGVSAFTVVRGVNGTTAAAHSSGATVTGQMVSPPLSIRHASAQNLGGLTRYVFDADNNLVGSIETNRSTITDAQFTTPLELNAITPQRMLIGGSGHIYESLTLGGPIVSIANVGVNPPHALAYGGRRNGIANPDVFYAGVGNQIYTRTTAGGVVAATAALPTGAGSIRDIVMDPTDWMTVFAVDDNQVFRSTDGGATWSDITGGLLAASSTEITTVEVVPGMSGYLAVGTRSGVFASQLTNLGTWVKLGISLPDVLAYELTYDVTDDVLVVATLGRGAWKLPTASAAFIPQSVAPVLTMTTAPTTANEGSTQYSYAFSVNDPGDRFTVTQGSPTITGGSLVPGSLTTTASGGSFKVTFADGPSTATISLQVTDSTGLTSNTATTNVTVANVAPTATILGAPTSGSPGASISLTSTVADPSAADVAAGFTRFWFVNFTPTGGSVYTLKTGNGESFTYTPPVAGVARVYLNTTDKDGTMRQTSVTISAASPNLTEDEVSLTVFEGQAAMNTGTYSHYGPAPLALSASVGDGEQTPTSSTALNVQGYWQLGEDDPSAVAGQTSNATTLGHDANGLNPALSLARNGSPTYTAVDGPPALIYDSFSGSAALAGPTVDTILTISQPLLITSIFNWHQNSSNPGGQDPTTVEGKIAILDYPSGDVRGTWNATGGGSNLAWEVEPNIVLPAGSYQIVETHTGPSSWSYTTTGGNAQWQANKGMTQIHASPVLPNNGSVLATNFNGSSDGYTLNSPVSAATDNFGIEARVKPSTASGSGVIAYNGNTSTSGFGIFTSSGNYWVLYGLNTAFDTGVAVLPGVWQDVALVRDNGVTQFYVNGSLANTYSVVGPNLPTGEFMVGMDPHSSTAFFNGAIDDVRVFTFAPGTFDPQDLGANTSVSGTWSWNYATDDGPTQSQDVVITATTGVSGDTTSIPFPLTVVNVAPTASLANSGPVNEGSTATVSFSNQADPSTADTTAGFHYAYDFDNDGIFEVGDGTYSGSVTSASATVPADVLAAGPGMRTVLGRIIDKDDGVNDYTTDIVINNAAPTASVSGPTDALVSQVVTFVISANDPSDADQGAGFSYSITWGDGATETISRAEGNGSVTARHAYAATGSYTIQVTATDTDGATSATANTAITVADMTLASLQALIDTTAIVYLQPTSDASLQSVVAAINGLSAPTAPVALTVILGTGVYSGVTLSPPANIALAIAGSDTIDADGTRIVGASPAITVTSGNVFVQGAVISTSTDSPTILVTGGNLTLGQVWIDESSGFNNAAINVTGGHVDYGFDVVTNINGEGGYFRIPSRSTITFPQGIDDFMVPNMFAVDGVYLPASHRSATSLAASLQESTHYGQAVTFTAVVDTNIAVLGHATGSVAFYDGATLLETVPLQIVGGQATATITTSSLGAGTHTIKAIYNGDNRFFSTEAILTYQVAPNFMVFLPLVARSQ
ncbi:BNR repeat-containing protein [Oscillochloris trichoides DG-6]|uniref:BNR repeat-containing protein n=1 Tax=Oscillochloris trichoides DG-6 TaxID=765420 RepID=E1IAP0_9CHLR|nr:LamG-like jellyroll fold domain-containing protein [Oscillochloris trichoides]EFO81719.1 BNR repeat-containing protein [Oscillochloris trichoides DG-6]